MNKHEDHKYIEALRTGNTPLIEELYQRYKPPISKWILRQGGNINDTNDIFQDTMQVLLEKAMETDYIQQYPIGGFMMKISQYIFYNGLRGEKKEKEVRNNWLALYKDENAVDILTLIISGYEKKNQNKILQFAFEQLSEICKKLLNAIRKDLNPQEIVDSMGFNSVNTYYRRKSACISSWKKLYQEYKI